MRQLFRRVLPLSALVALVTFGVPTPAVAHTDVCTGTFTLSSASGLGAPITSSTNTTVIITSNLGACVSGTTFHASASFTGTCTLATGAGITNTGHSFAYQMASTMVFTGSVHGTLNVVEDFTDSGTCLGGTASGFFLTGTVVLAP